MNYDKYFNLVEKCRRERWKDSTNFGWSRFTKKKSCRCPLNDTFLAKIDHIDFKYSSLVAP